MINWFVEEFAVPYTWFGNHLLHGSAQSELLEILNKTLQNASITASFANLVLSFYQREHRLRQDIKITAGSPFDFYLLVNRRSTLGPRERILMNAGVKPFASIRC